MSTMSVSNITTANSTEPLTMSTGNTAGAKIVVTQNDSSFTGNVAIFRLLANAALGTAGQVLVSGGTSTNAYWAAGGKTVAVKETIYAANGTHTKDANLVSLMVYVIGAGGGGGGSNSAATATGAKGGSGGGGGGVAIKILQNAEVGATSNVVVGIGGTGGANSTNTGTGGSNSSFANSTGGLITGQGGAVGASAGATGGAGGPAINGDLNIQGSDGHSGSGASGSYNNGIGGAGGTSGLGFGAGGAIIQGSSVGKDGDLYGGGGGGSSSANSGVVSRAGGNGANGAVWVIEYYTI